MSRIREPFVAGMFYPRNENELISEVSLLLKQNEPEVYHSNVHGVVAPHAGYIYSGRTAAFAFNSLLGKDFETAVIISPSHREYFAGISIYDGEGFKTPLGVVPINHDKVNQLSDGSKVIFKGEIGHMKEHGIEVEIPFLQIINKDLSIVPIVMGDQSDLYINELAGHLKKIIDEKTIIVASSDLSHFYSRPIAEKLDSVIEERINNFDFNSLQKDLNKKICEACGGGPIVAMMKALSDYGMTKAKVLHRTDSGEITRDFNEVVGYLSAVVYN